MAEHNSAHTRTRRYADIDVERFRRVMGSLVGGVSVVSAIDDDGRPCGLTCSAVCSVSEDPPLLLFCVKDPSSTLEAVKQRGTFAVNMLAAEGREVAKAFAGLLPNKYDGIGWRPAALTGMPVFELAMAHVECVVHDLVDAGDHTIVLGRMVGGEVDIERFPLGYWRRDYVHVFRMTDRRRNGSLPAS